MNIVSMNPYIVLILSIMCSLLSLTVFSKGFLLTRVAIEDIAGCDKNLNTTTVCSMAPKFKKAILLVIDGLRYDFVLPPGSRNETNNFYHDKLKIFHEFANTLPSKAKLFKFIADPPTTTMQRIKGLMTGSLPTFIDVGANFYTYEIKEDNLIDQLVSHGKNVYFVGDDTWEGLFPNKFKACLSYSSFNVFDLHTVDKGVMSNIFPLMQTDDWDVIVAHMLGVDHCGHKFGPNHSAMSEKLQELDMFLRNFLAHVDQDTLFIAFGDHGMTETGDHGGDSEFELESALFIYSNSSLFCDVKSDHISIPQIDLTPTFSLLMGLPIPFSNIGSVIQSLFGCNENTDYDSHKGEIIRTQLEAVLINAVQVQTYLNKYRISKGLPESILKQQELLSQLINEATENIFVYNNTYKLKNLAENIKNVLLGIQKFLHIIWATFDESFLLEGIIGILVNIVFIACQFNHSNIGKIYYVLVLVIFPIWQVLLLTYFNYVFHCAFVVYSCLVIYLLLWSRISQLFHCGFDFRKMLGLMNADVFVGLLIPCLSFCCYFSNSFIISEDSTTSFFLISITIYLSFTFVVSKKMSIKLLPNVINQSIASVRKIDKSVSIRGQISFLAMLILCLVIRLSHYFKKCREEQYWCSDEESILFWFDKGDKSYKNFMYILAFMSLFLLITFHKWWLRKCGNLNGYATGVLVSQYLPQLAGLCICFHWLIQELPARILDQFTTWQVNAFALFLYLLFLIGMLMLLLFPLCIYRVKGKTIDIGPVVSEDVFVRKMFTHLRNSWKDARFSSKSRPPVVYGLATVFSATISSFSLIVLLFVLFLLGPSLTASGLLYWVCLLCVIVINAMVVLEESKTEDDLLKVRWITIVIWSLLVSYFFYGTGHQTTFPAIPWRAAFVGNNGDFSSYLTPVSLVISNIYGTDLIGSIFLPILLISPLTLSAMFPSLANENASKNHQQGEFLLIDDIQPRIINLINKYYLLSSIRLLGIMCAAALLRRHLMVWKIFAPRLMFESVRYVIVCPGLLIGMAIVHRIAYCLAKWVNNLEKENLKIS